MTANIMIDFVKNTIEECEKDAYTVFGSASKNSETLLAVLDLIVSRFNKAYSDIINKRDTELAQKFHAMREVDGHSYICLLCLAFNACFVSFHQLPRNDFDTSSLEAYMNSMRAHFEPSLFILCQTLESTLSHECDGEDIFLCDPSGVMFEINYN